MDQIQAHRRAKQYIALGYEAVARADDEEEWIVAIRGVTGEYYREFDVRVTRARDAWVKQHARKPDAKCVCGYDPMTQQDLDDHVAQVHGQEKETS